MLNYGEYALSLNTSELVNGLYPLPSNYSGRKN